MRWSNQDAALLSGAHRPDRLRDAGAGRVGLPARRVMLTPVADLSTRFRHLVTGVAASTPGARSMAGDEADLRRAVDNHEFEVYYQPLVALEDRSIVAVEGLVRWNHPDRGLLTPEAFMETAERTGLITGIGTQVLEEACRQGAAWRRLGIELDVGVNLSAKELPDPQLIERVTAALATSGMNPHDLWLEITETSLVEDVEEASAVLHRLVDLGVRVSIDDFGTGWASLTYLKEFPVHALKIDRSFVHGVDRNVNDAAIARSILSLGAELGLVVVAEGIETVAQQDALRALGCSLGQGFLYGRPSPADAVPVDRARGCGAIRARARVRQIKQHGLAPAPHSPGRGPSGSSSAAQR